MDGFVLIYDYQQLVHKLRSRTTSDDGNTLYLDVPNTL